MTAILGISAYYHDSAAALLVDGQLVAAAQEERFSRQKHDARFPNHAIHYCMSQAGLGYDELDHVVFYEKPFRKFERLLETYLSVAPSGWTSFARSMPVWLKQKLYLSREIQRQLDRRFAGRIIFPEHHESHAASAFFPSPFQRAAILTADGVGEWATTTLGRGDGNRVELLEQLEFPHSLGLLYSAFTTFCGFRVNSGEAKLMGLAPYGRPRYVERIRDKLIDIRPDGSFRLDLDYFQFQRGLTMTSRRFHQLFDGPPRTPETEITQREKDLAASVQAVVEEILLGMARHLHRQTGLENLCIAGGLGLNCVANGELRRHSPFRNIWVQPAAGDAGGALGAALFTWHQLRDQPREPMAQQTVFTGPDYSPQQIAAAIEQSGLAEAPHIESSIFQDRAALCDQVSDLLAQKKVIGWFQGRMEFGPRALGNRSMLADPRCPHMQDRINQEIKFRESFRPFAPVVLANAADRFFEVPARFQSPFMLLAEQVKAVESRSDAGPGETGALTLPAITHVNQSARLQTVTPQQNGPLAQLLETMEQKTGCPVLLNTSLNVRGQPIACSPTDALDLFATTALDAIVLENCLLVKSAEKNGAPRPPLTTRQPVSPGESSPLKLYKLPVAGAAGGLAAYVLWGSLSGALTILLVSLLLWGTGKICPRALAPLATGLDRVLRFIAMWFTIVLLALVYFLVLTPYALLLRLLGHRGLETRFERGDSSYWKPHRSARSKHDYFRQF
ncbi:MAG: carbamoyltransferase [Mariniblastus sp.]|nr:carbamoyltransferase [Mariniblastus sp.]